MPMMSHPDSYRRLTAAEIAALEAQGCAATDWCAVWVHPAFSPAFVRDALLSGDVVLGNFGDAAEAKWRKTGLYRVRLHNVAIGDHCLLQEVDGVENYIIGNDVTVTHVGQLCASLDSTFGNATEVAVLNESGGREVLIHNQLTAQEAYVMALHGYRTAQCAALRQRIADEAAALRGLRGTVGDGCRISYVRSLRNVRIGDAAVIEGASSLAEGSIVSTSQAPVTVGDGVSAEGFIIRAGSHVLSGASLTHCFVGESCHIGHGFSATDSLFFANCQMENGEACALFAGPFSVSHHKATLLIACMTSFFNAGSGSNQSNHSYKLGPNKYGILERGAKLASSSYIYWPARIGAFSTVLGHHSVHADLSDFPFSLVMESKGKSLLIPAVNLRSIGLVRDVQKWPTRDGRHSLTTSSDDITYSLLNPYTAARIERALAQLKEWIDALPEGEESQSSANEYISYRGVYIPRVALQRAQSTYSAALDEYLSRNILLRFEHTDAKTAIGFLTAGTSGTGAWCDYGGLIAPQAEVERDDAALALSPSADDLAAWEWNWIAAAAERVYGRLPGAMTETDLCKIAVIYELTSEWLQTERLTDSAKEYAEAARLLYGADGTEADRRQDFEACFGANSMDDSFVHKFHREWKEQRARITQIGRRFRSDLA